MHVFRVAGISCLIATLSLFPTTLMFAADDAVPNTPPTIDTPISVLLEHAAARAIVEKHLPRLVAALDDDLEILRFMGSSSLRELEIDDDHVIGFDAKMLAAIQLELQGLDATNN